MASSGTSCVREEGSNTFAGEINAMDVPIPGSPRSIIPLTLKTISMLLPSLDSEHTFHIHGMPITMVRVVGRMLGRRDVEGETSFSIDDGTGSIDARIDLGVSYQPDLGTVRDGDYVVTNGVVEYYGSVRSMNVYSFRCVRDFNHITHHFLQCVFAYLDLKRRAKVRRDASRTSVMDIQDLSAVSDEVVMWSDGSYLFDNVLRVFRQPGIRDLENGASFALIQKRTGASEADLRSVISSHLTLGNMFTTIDEDHYKSSMNC